MTTSTPLPAPDDQDPTAMTIPEPVRADSVSSRFELLHRPAPVSLRTVAIVLVVSLVATLAVTATVLGLQLLASTLGT